MSRNRDGIPHAMNAMQDNGEAEGAVKPPPSGSKGPLAVALRLIFGMVLPAAVLLAGARFAYHLYETGPKAPRGPSTERNARLVEVQKAHFSRENTIVHAMGTVKPAREIQLQPRVSGEIIEVSRELLPGGLLLEDEMIIRIDPTDYELIVRQRAGELASAESEYQLELGSQSIAQREYELLGEQVLEEDRDLVLRQPQLRTVQAALDIAKALLEKAQLDLERTTVRAPFNALVQSYEVNLGAQVSGTTKLATLVGTDEYWIELSVPVDQLQWIRIPYSTDEGKGSLVRVYNETAWGSGLYRTGWVLRLAGDLEPEGLMARILVRVPDPLSLTEENTATPRLLIGSYVRVEIEGRSIDNVIALPRRLLRDGDTVWILNEEGHLDIRPVTIAYSSRHHVLISSGIEEGELIVSTDLAAPVSGMPLRTEEGEPIPGEEEDPSTGTAVPDPLAPALGGPEVGR